MDVAETERLVAMGSEKQDGSWDRVSGELREHEALLPGTSTVSESFRTPMLHFEGPGLASSACCVFESLPNRPPQLTRPKPCGFPEDMLRYLGVSDMAEQSIECLQK